MERRILMSKFENFTIKKSINDKFYQDIDCDNYNVVYIAIFFRQVRKLFRL